MNLGKLIAEYGETGKIKGDCQEISTVTTGILFALGIVARRYRGEIVYTAKCSERLNNLTIDLEKKRALLKRMEANAPPVITNNQIRLVQELEQRIASLQPDATYKESGLHIWTEFYVPLERGVWFLMDLSQGIIKSYPTLNSQFYADCPIPKFFDPSKQARIKVEQENSLKGQRKLVWEWYKREMMLKKDKL